jgi:hypothetical protein
MDFSVATTVCAPDPIVSAAFVATTVTAMLVSVGIAKVYRVIITSRILADYTQMCCVESSVRRCDMMYSSFLIKEYARDRTLTRVGATHCSRQEC